MELTDIQGTENREKKVYIYIIHRKIKYEL